MKNLALSVALGVTAVALSLPVNAGVTSIAPNVTTITTGSTSRTDNRALIGINWTFGSKAVPELVLGFRSMKIKSNGDASGGGIDLTFPLAKGAIGFDKIRVKGIDGHYDGQGELGFGYSLVSSSFLLTGGVQLPYIVGGADYLINGGWVPYVGLNTQGRYDRPKQSTTRSLSCNAGYSLVAASVSEPQVDGMTCRFAPPPPA
jgi:hypothetical protein